jgi:predicted DNA-binding protein with PD1-like motif
MGKISLVLIFSVMLQPGFVFSQNKTADTATRYIKTPTGYLMVLRQGDDVLQYLEKLATIENIPSANYSGMGFVNATFGFFNFQTKEYEPKELKDVELASMTGSIAWQKGKVSLHTHGVVTGKDFTARGGHLLAATVGTGSVEINVIVHDKRLERVEEQPLGANVLQLNSN